MKYSDFKNELLSIIFPKKCKYCGALIVPKKDICDDCCGFLPTISMPVCQFCGHSVEDCTCKHHKSEFSAVAAPFYYDGAIKKAIHRLKFESHEFVAETLAGDMVKTVKEQYSDIAFDKITFVPFSSSEKHSREFNQSELLARELSKGLQIPLSEALVKLYDVPAQHTLPGKKRKGNVFGIYDTLPGCELNGKTILLVDDIKTTGSTLSECAKMLKVAGAEKVYAVTAAITKNN